MNEPSEITAGFQYSWEETLSDYPADDGWSLKYKGLNASGKIEITADADGSGYSVTLAPATTSDYTAGIYTFYKYVEHTDGRKYQISSYTVEVFSNPITATTLDTRTHARKMFEALEALEIGRADHVQKAFSIAGRQIEYLSPEEIIKWKNHYKRIMLSEEGIPPVRKRLTKFSDPFV